MLAGLLLLQPAIVSVYYAGHLADAYEIRQGETLTLHTIFPITATSADTVTAAALTNQHASQKTDLKLFGIFPIKQIELQTVDTVMLVPCGQPFGVRMLMDGIMVIGFGEVAARSGSCCPAVTAGVQEGDMIQEINHQKITCTEDFKQAVSESQGESLLLSVQRGDVQLEINIQPAYSILERCWQTGLWVRDSTAGIGTLTYYEPESGAFGGLGHPICDPDTGERIPLGSGYADAVTISGVIKGQEGSAGQLQGYFSGDAPIGTLDSNCECGIFGHLENLPEDDTALPMALKQEITLGEAILLTTVEGAEPKPYTVQITALDYTDNTQNMIIEVTDEELLSCTGGIVQGMSGSPILQNGKLIGAVTHVFVSQPAMGYAVFAENMYEYTNQN